MDIDVKNLHPLEVRLLRHVSAGEDITPERIIQQFHLEALAAWFADWGAEAMLLGCTHFPYFKDTLAAQTTLPLIDPAEEMVVMLNRQNN